MTLMLNALPEIREPENSPFIGFERGSKERTLLVKEIENIRASDPEVLPLWIGGPRHTLENTKPCIVPHDQNRTLAFYSIASKKHVEEAIETVLNAREAWSQIPWPMRLNIFQTAARLLEKKYLYKDDESSVCDLRYLGEQVVIIFHIKTFCAKSCGA